MRADLLDEPRSSGAFLLSIWKTLRELVGDEAYQAGLDALPADERDEIAQAQAISWVRMRVSSDFIDAVAKAAGREPERLYDESVQKSVERTYRGVWKVFLRFTSPEAFLTRASLMYSKSRNWGKMTATMLGDQKAELRIVDWPQMSDRAIRSIGITSVTILQITGQRKADYTATPTRDGALIRLAWR